MNPKWIENGKAIRDYYQGKALKNAGDVFASLDWRSEVYYAEFVQKVLAGISADMTENVLDVGCGYALFRKFIEDSFKKKIRYVGIDLCSEFISVAKKCNKDSCFYVGNFLARNFHPNERFDLVVNLGGLNSRVCDQLDYMIWNVTKMLKLSRKYVVFNLLLLDDPSSFGNRNGDVIGHIGYYDERKVVPALVDLEVPGLNLCYSKYSIFQGTYDLFVRFTYDN